MVFCCSGNSFRYVVIEWTLRVGQIVQARGDVGLWGGAARKGAAVGGLDEVGGATGSTAFCSQLGPHGIRQEGGGGVGDHRSATYLQSSLPRQSSRPKTGYLRAARRPARRRPRAPGPRSSTSRDRKLACTGARHFAWAGFRWCTRRGNTHDEQRTHTGAWKTRGQQRGFLPSETRRRIRGGGGFLLTLAQEDPGGYYYRPLTPRRRRLLGP